MNSADAIGRITPAGKVTVYRKGITKGSKPGLIALGYDGNMWFTETDGNRIGRITPKGVVTEFSKGITKGAGPIGIAAGPDGNMWFTETGWQPHWPNRHGSTSAPAQIVIGYDNVAR